MMLKRKLMENAKELFESLDCDLSELFEETYKNKVVINAAISLIINKNIFTKEELETKIAEIRKEIKEKD